MKYLMIAAMGTFSVLNAFAYDQTNANVLDSGYSTNVIAPIDGCRSLCTDSFANNSSQCSAYLTTRDYQACLGAANRIYYACLSRCRS